MNEEHIQFGAKEIRKIGMTAEEKKRVLEQVLKTPLPAKPVRSPWLRHTFASFSKKHTFAFYTAACTLVLVLGGTSLVYASSGSLPGNALYPLKTDVVEPLRSALTFSLEAKAEYESHLATERLIEAETLASDNKLDASKEAELNLLLENHADALNKALGKIRAEKKAASRGDDAGKNSNDGDEEIVTNFKAEMNAHARVLDVLRGHGPDADDPSSADDASKISNTARDNAENMRGSWKGGNAGKSDAYSKHKNAIQSIIDSTVDNLNTQHSGDDSSDASARRRKIIDDTHKTLDQARELLKEADDDSSRGDRASAYSKLIDSESSAKEAGIFLRTGLRFGDKD